MYNLVEIFESLQGEGRNTGRPCVFVRFAGCNLKCPWCDTDVKKRFEVSLDELLAELGQYKAKSVILTGGEPTIQAEMPELVAALKKAGYWIGVETNGTVAADWLGFVDYVACSPKMEFAEFYSGDRNIAAPTSAAGATTFLSPQQGAISLKSADEVRVVASDEKTVEFCKKIRRQIAATDYYVSPCDHDGEIDFATAKSVLSRLDGWSLSVQLHKLLGFR